MPGGAVDTITENWCVQIKHKSSADPFDWSQLGRPKAEAEAYLDLIRAQAVSQGKTPVLIINSQGITDALMELLNDPAKIPILFRVVLTFPLTLGRS